MSNKLTDYVTCKDIVKVLNIAVAVDTYRGGTGASYKSFAHQIYAQHIESNDQELFRIRDLLASHMELSQGHVGAILSILDAAIRYKHTY